MCTLFRGFVCFLLLTAIAAAADFNGKWKFSVDLDNGGHGEPEFVLEQKGSKLAGTYSGPVGEQKVEGTVDGDKAVFGFTVLTDGEARKFTYTAVLESPTKM